MTKKLLTLNNITVTISNFSLKNISLDVYEGEYLVILGSSGVGKSILLETIAGLYQKEEGSIFLNGQDLSQKKIRDREIGIVYQDNTLFPHLSVRKNLEYGLKCKKYSKKDINRATNDIAKKLKIESLMDRSCNFGLSGGEVQRISLARSLLIEPKLLLLDEPLSALDVETREKIQILLKKIHLGGQTLIHVTHDPSEAFALADRIVVLERGKITQKGSVEDILNFPKTKFIANLSGIKNFFSGVLKKEEGEFETEGITFFTQKLNENRKEIKTLFVSSSDIMVSLEKREIEKPPKNSFEAFVKNITPKKDKIELTLAMNSSTNLYANIAREKFKNMKIEIDKKLFVSFYKTSIKLM